MKKILLSVFLVILFPISALAAQVSSGESVTLDKVQKNPIIFSTNVNIDSKVDGDLTVFAQNIKVKGEVGSSAYLFGENIEVTGPINNRLIIASATSVIKSEVKGDLIALSGNITIDNSAKIDGDVFAYGGEVNIKGKVSGDLRTGGSKVVLDGALIGKDATIQSEQIQLSDNSQVLGKLSYLSKKEMSFNSDLVSGGVTFKKLKTSTSNSAFGYIGSIVMIIILALFVNWLGRERIDQGIKDLQKNLGSVWLTGILSVILTPIALMLLAISYVGIYVFALVLLIYLVAWLLASVYASIAVGHYTVKLLTKNQEVKTDWSTIVFGSVIFVLIGLIPVIGGFIKFLLLVAGFGIFVNQLKKLKQSK